MVTFGPLHNGVFIEEPLEQIMDGWHTRLNNMAKGQDFNIYLLINVSQDEAINVSFKIQSFRGSIFGIRNPNFYSAGIH